MEITSKKELDFVIKADLMMNRGKFKNSFIDMFKGFFIPDYIVAYLKAMRRCSYYKHSNRLLFCFYHRKFRKLGIKLGFSIGYNTLGYGVVIPHYGTIVVGGTNRIGNYAVLHTSTCISDNGKIIGDAMYLATGVKMTSKLVLGDNVSIGANSLVNKDFGSGVMIAGCPAKVLKNSDAWYVREGGAYLEKVRKVENLRKQLGLFE